MIPYGRQSIDKDDLRAVEEALTSDYLTTGPKVSDFEKVLCEFTGAKYAVAVNSGTSALDIAVGALELPKGSEIITTPFSFAASTNCILYNGCKPVFADIDKKTYNIDPKQIRKKITSKTNAIIYVDYSGQPCDIDEIKEIAKEKNLKIIEDAAHALGAKYKGKLVGGFADLTEFSFHPVKHITTGEGGAITTNSEELYKKMRLLRNHGIDKTPAERTSYKYDMVLLGRNYRITDIQCALGISQMKKIDKFLKRRKDIVNQYNKKISSLGTGGLEIPFVASDRENAWHLYTVLVPKEASRDKVFDEMRKRGIGVNVHYIPTYKFSYYRKNFGFKDSDYPVTEEVSSRILSLPVYYGLTDEQIDTVVKALKESIDEAKT
ncbi:UDP-4-amino-4,6-dideoxy-N-acetyl-beta-L-altrosamine transaminase [Candidatus Micrarchaeota archaeon]|nr:UDP-4-amino-4,6-dideoxy-N-acetyl-beta-L-altrosamine transaminase [Candidatus Micrarchaeota archaeon]